MKKTNVIIYVFMVLLLSTASFGCATLPAASDPSDPTIVLENPKIPPDPVMASGPLTTVQQRTSSPTPPEDLVPISSRSSDSDAPHQRFLSNKQFMLGLINEERRKAGVTEVSLGDNNAAQIHAENMIRDCFLAHWGVDGLGPPMRYSLAGGYQSNAENASGYDYCLTDENRSMYLPIQSIQSELRDNMAGYMASPGHKDNILDPWHRKVNLGLAWDTHEMWTVQHFEGDYVDCSVPPTIEETTLRVSCTVSEVLPSNAFAQQIFYDPPPHELTRGQLARSFSYGSGRKVALLRQRAPAGRYYPSDETTSSYFSGCTPYDVDSTLPPPSSFDEATTLFNEAKLCERSEETITVPWIDGEESISGSQITLSHDIEQVLTEHGNGVYTLVVWGCSVADSREDPCEDDDVMPILEKSIFYGIDPPDTYTPSEESPSTLMPTATPTPVTASTTPAPRVDCGSAVSDTSNTALVADCEYLLGMKSTLRGGARLNWWSGRTLNNWDGIQIQDGRVTEVSLPNRMLDGILPVGIGNLSALKTLDLSGNSLTGTIPASLNNLIALTKWRLAGNNFTGCVPANFAQVSDNDAASLNLPSCGGSGPVTPTPTPTPVVTPTPTPGEDDLATLLAEGHCTQADISHALGGTHTRTDFAPFVKHDVNGWGLSAFARSQWVNDNDSAKHVYCWTFLYDNVSSAVLDANYDRMRGLVEGSLDVLTQRKVRGLPDIGNKFRALQIQLGEDRDVGTEDSLAAGVTVSMLQREHVVVFVGEIRLGNNVSAHLLRSRTRPPSVDGVVAISRRIDARLVAIAETGEFSAESLSAESFSGSEFFGIAPTR